MNRSIWNRLLSEKGTSFIEIMISLVIMGVITISIFKTYINQHQNYIAQDDVTTIQQNARASIDEISRNVRMAGYRLPDMLDAITASNTDPDTIVITFYDGNCDTYLSAAMPLPSAELKVGTDPSCFSDNQWVYIFEPDSGVGEWFMISHVQAAAKHIQHNTMTLSRAYGADAILLGMRQVKYFVDTSIADHPKLMVQWEGKPPEIFADDITDLQFQFRMKNGIIEDVPSLPDNVREVIITVTGRSANKDVENPDQPYRHRTYSTSVYVRNLDV